MKNQREIYEALLAGETLVSNDGHEVNITDNGNLTTRGSITSFVYPSDWQIHKEPKWYENIPDGGVLCWCYDVGDVAVIRNIKRLNGLNTDQQSINFWNKAIPLTKQEIQLFMDNAPEVK